MRTASRGTRDYTYKVTVPASGSAVSLDTFKMHIKKEPGDVSEDALLQVYLNAAVAYAEKITKRDFLWKTYETSRDYFPEAVQSEGYYLSGCINHTNLPSFEIRKSPLESVEKIDYMDADNNWQELANDVYSYTVEQDYSEVYLIGGKSWPESATNKLQTIIITFTAGLVEDSETFERLYPSYVLAILGHATSIWANRGDCSEESCPASSLSIYKQNQIINI